MCRPEALIFEPSIHKSGWASQPINTVSCSTSKLHDALMVMRTPCKVDFCSCARGLGQLLHLETVKRPQPSMRERTNR